MSALWARIIARYVLGALLVSAGIVAPGLADMLAADPDVIELLTQGAALIGAGAVELWYLIVRRKGGPT